jgi:3-deoxy-D-manno-octulosonate 8-phosphate phosphatase KdsC-like HAD superfamily phosphatase
MAVYSDRSNDFVKKIEVGDGQGIRVVRAAGKGRELAG